MNLLDVLENFSQPNSEMEVDDYRVRLMYNDALPFPLWKVLAEKVPYLVIDLINRKTSIQSSDKENMSNEELTMVVDKDEEEEDTLNENDKMREGDFTGSPLKLNLLDLSRLRAGNRTASTVNVTALGDADASCQSTTSMSASLARSLIASMLRKIESRGQSKDGQIEHLGKVPILLLTDGRDSCKTAALGFQSMTSAGLKTSIFQAKGYGRLKWLINVLDPSERFKHSQAKFLARCRLELLAGSGKFKRSAGNSNDVPYEEVSASLSVDAEWPCASNECYMSMPPAHASVIINVRPGWLDERTPSHDRCLELQILLSLAGALRTGEMCWMGSDRVILAKETLTAVEACHRLVSASKSALYVSDRKALDIEQMTVSESTRDMDFTEQLWMIVKECTDNNHLIKCLSLVFEALKMKDCRPMVQTDSRSTIGRLCEDACRDRLLLPRLEGLYPVQMTLEIGLDKVRRDMLDSFASAGLTSASSLLTPLFRLDESIECQTDVLRPILASLQTVLLCCSLLKLPQHHLAVIARETLIEYSKRRVAVEDLEYQHELRVTDLSASILESVSPAEWSLESIYKQSKEEIARNVVHFGLKPLFSHVAYETETDAEMSKQSNQQIIKTEHLYYMSQITESCVLY